MSTPHGLGEHASPVGDDRTTTNPPDGGMAAPSLYGERGGLGYNPARPEGRGLPDRPRRTEGGGSPYTAIRNMDVRGSNVGMKTVGVQRKYGLRTAVANNASKLPHRLAQNERLAVEVPNGHKNVIRRRPAHGA